MDTFDFDEKDGLGIPGKTHWCAALDGFDGETIHHLQCRRNDSGCRDIHYGLGCGLHPIKNRQQRAHGLLVCMSLTATLVTIPIVPSEPTKTPQRS